MHTYLFIDIFMDKCAQYVLIYFNLVFISCIYLFLGPVVNHVTGIPCVTSAKLCVMSALKQCLGIFHRGFIKLHRKQLKRNKSVIWRFFFLCVTYFNTTFNFKTMLQTSIVKALCTSAGLGESVISE